MSRGNINPPQQSLCTPLKTAVAELLHWPNVAGLEIQALETALCTQTLEPQ